MAAEWSPSPPTPTLELQHEFLYQAPRAISSRAHIVSHHVDPSDVESGAGRGQVFSCRVSLQRRRNIFPRSSFDSRQAPHFWDWTIHSAGAVGVLLEFRADPTIKNKDGMTPLEPQCLCRRACDM